MHNLAEFYLSTARDIEATQIQEEILALAEKPNNIEKSSFVTRENAKGFTTTEGIRVYRSSEKSSDL